MAQAKGYKTLLIIYFSLFAGQVVFVVIAAFIVKQKMFVARPALENLLLPIVSVLALICIIIGNKLFRKRVQKLANIHVIAERFSDYRSISLTRWAILEGPCLFAIICFLLTANNLFLILAAVILFVFWTTAPVKNKVAADLGITPADLDSIE